MDRTSDEKIKKKLEFLNYRKRSKKYLTLQLNIRPKSKKQITTKEMNIFLQYMFSHMKKYGYKQFHNNVAIELIISTNDGNTPHIENYIKNIIDLLYESKTIQGKKLSSPENLNYFPLKDDNQIKYLKVKYLSKSQNPIGVLKIRLFSSMLSDINFLIKKSLIPEKNKYEDDDIKNYYSLLKRKETIIEHLSEKSINSMYNLDLHAAQSQILRNLRLTCNLMHLIYAERNYSTEVKNIFNDYSQYAINSPFNCILKDLPSRDKSKKKFKDDIRDSFNQYLKKNQIFKELMGPVSITAFYKPFNTNRIEQRDLDNIMREFILPIFNQCFNPPTSYYNLEDRRFNKSLQKSVLSYEIVEIPQKYNQISEGFLSISFNMIDIINDDSIFQITDDIIGNYFKPKSV